MDHSRWIWVRKSNGWGRVKVPEEVLDKDTDSAVKAAWYRDKKRLDQIKLGRTLQARHGTTLKKNGTRRSRCSNCGWMGHNIRNCLIENVERDGWDGFEEYKKQKAEDNRRLCAERAKREQEIRREKKRVAIQMAEDAANELFSQVEHTPEAMILMDPSCDQILDVIRQISEITGLTEGQATIVVNRCQRAFVKRIKKYERQTKMREMYDNRSEPDVPVPVQADGVHVTDHYYIQELYQLQMESFLEFAGDRWWWEIYDSGILNSGGQDQRLLERIVIGEMAASKTQHRGVKISKSRLYRDWRDHYKTNECAKADRKDLRIMLTKADARLEFDLMLDFISDQHLRFTKTNHKPLIELRDQLRRENPTIGRVLGKRPMGSRATQTVGPLGKIVDKDPNDPNASITPDKEDGS